MAPRTRWMVFLVSTPLVMLVTVGGLIGPPKAATQQSLPELRILGDVVGLINNAYVEPVDIDKVMDGAMRGLAEGLDPSSAFLEPDEVRAIETKAPLPAGDVGLMVERQFYLRVMGVRDGSPAAKAGLQSGDYIRMIDTKPTRDMSAFTGRRLLRGAPGTKVSLTIIRGNTADPHTFELVRQAPAGPSATSKMIGDVAHVRISTFDSTVPDTLRAIFKTLESKATGAVIDLRGIADNDLEAGIAAARPFVKSGTIAVRAMRKGEPVKTEAGSGDGTITMPVVLLLSNGTANAAEVFAAALQGNKRADIVGEPTAGLAGVQRLVKLPQGYGLWLTSERYLTVDGSNPIHERGLLPTVGVPIPVVAFDELPPTTDVPLEKAIEHLKSKR
ncbi:MAG TPA: S41 family peptidase [Vicinamibacterales bacterium]|nr:S41 family peptidase [Vicinamibacterales bacterium]